MFKLQFISVYKKHLQAIRYSFNLLEMQNDKLYCILFSGNYIKIKWVYA